MVPPPAVTDPALYERLKRKIKARVHRWPSAYASGMLVQAYKDEMKKRGKPPYLGTPKSKTGKKGLPKWFAEEWVDVITGKPCGQVRTHTYYPTCRPKRISNKLTPAQRHEAAEIKQLFGKHSATYPAYFRS